MQAKTTEQMFMVRPVGHTAVRIQPEYVAGNQHSETGFQQETQLHGVGWLADRNNSFSSVLPSSEFSSYFPCTRFPH